MGVDVVLSYLGEKALDRTPGWLSRRIAPVQKVARQVEIDLWRDQPIVITFGGTVPRVEVNFRVDNRSHVDLTLDRLIIEFWVGQPVFEGAVLHRYELPKQSDHHHVHFRHYLGYYDGGVFFQQHQRNPIVEEVSLEVTGYFVSKTDTFTVHKQMEHRNVRIEGLPRTKATPG